ncbi:MAG: hypothetical protein Q8Q37_01550 [bacterium]|nr:hypothetical protein [bacterium]
MTLKNIILAIILIAVGYILTAGSTSAQTAPQFMVNWKANDYVAPDYLGKILPTRNTKVDVGFELIDNNRPLNLSNYQIRWYVNDKLRTSGSGKKGFSFNINAITHSPQIIKIIVVNYRETDLEKTFVIPVVNPEVHLQSLGDYKFGVRPFFFNVININNINFRWTVNNSVIDKLGDQPNVLDLGIQNYNIGDIINLEVSVNNPFNKLETAATSINLNIK